ncbi:M48 family metalloprotease [Streptomyces sp. NPDC060223]|uniref:M48 family metalloprotease n=1 Tax=unclassified Streptomyces TaxID=2593676 RepID=UPI003638C7D1
MVVTTATLRSRGPAEREALFAHERAHNRAGHHYFRTAARTRRPLPPRPGRHPARRRAGRRHRCR